MRLRVLGSADAFNSAGRGHSSYWLESPGAGPIAIDFGATTLMRLRAEGLRASDMAGIAITHLHGDHVGGLPFLWIDSMYHERRSAPLAIVGPVGTREKILALLEVTYAHADRIDWMLHAITEIAPGESAPLCGFTVHGFAAEHMDLPDRPLCLRIADAHGKSVAFSGDTELCDGLFAASEGAEMLVAECTQLTPPAGKHCTWEGWKTAFHRVKAQRLMLTHLGDDVRDAAPRIRGDAPPSLDLAFAEDGAIYDF